MKYAGPFMFYFLYFAALSALAPYVALYYQSLGLPGWQIGLLTGLAPLISLVGAPVGTGLADATHRHRLVLSLTIASVIVLALLIPGVQSFALLLPLVLLYALIAAPIPALADSATLCMLGDEREMYGRVRVGGTLGWGAMAAFAGALIQRNGLRWSFWLYALGMAATLLVGQLLTFGRAQPGLSIRSGARSLLASPRWALFLIMVFFGGMGMATVNTYLFVYMEAAGASRGLMGLTLTLSTLSELPVMFFGNLLLRRLRSSGLLGLAMAAIGLRLVLQAAFNAPIALLLIQLVHGLTFPAMWVAGVSFAHEQAPPGMAATAQGLFGAVMMGFGAAAGNFLGGLLLQGTGGRGMYFIVGAVVLTSLLAGGLLAQRLPRPQVEAA